MGIMDRNNANLLIFPDLAGNALRVYARGYGTWYNYAVFLYSVTAGEGSDMSIPRKTCQFRQYQEVYMPNEHLHFLSQ